jgi:Raf kinase inhibitor-like YbhB/YbcL family protein
MAMGFVRAIGVALQPFRPGPQSFGIRRKGFAELPDSIEVRSDAFMNGGQIPERHTADGAGTSPPLRIDSLPAGTHSLVLLVEDADSPSFRPFVHAIVYDLPPDATSLEEGALPPPPAAEGGPQGSRMGRNFAGRTGWTPPSPPPGHGPHRYAFEVFALASRPRFDWPPGREHLLRTIRPLATARGCLIGLYQRK